MVRPRLVRVPTPYVQYAGPWGQAALRLRYVPNAGGWHTWPVRTLRRPRGVRVSSGRDARARRWVVLATERDDVPGQVRRQAVTYAWAGCVAGSVARRPVSTAVHPSDSGPLASRVPQRTQFGFAVVRRVRASIYLSIYLSTGMGGPAAVLAADGAPLHKVLAPIGLVDLLQHRVVRRVPARQVSQSVSHYHTPTNGAHGPHPHARS